MWGHFPPVCGNRISMLERVASEQLSDPATDDMSVPLAIESVRLAQVVMNQYLKRPRHSHEMGIGG